MTSPLKVPLSIKIPTVFWHKEIVVLFHHVFEVHVKYGPMCRYVQRKKKEKQTYIYMPYMFGIILIEQSTIQSRWLWLVSPRSLNLKGSLINKAIASTYCTSNMLHEVLLNANVV